MLFLVSSLSLKFYVLISSVFLEWFGLYLHERICRSSWYLVIKKKKSDGPKYEKPFLGVRLLVFDNTITCCPSKRQSCCSVKSARCYAIRYYLWDYYIVMMLLLLLYAYVLLYPKRFLKIVSTLHPLYTRVIEQRAREEETRESFHLYLIDNEQFSIWTYFPYLTTW